MARAIDADKLLDDITAAEENGGMGAIVAGTLRRYVMRQPTLTPPNEPLTSDELRQMDGEPVYIVFLPDIDGEKLQFWALVAVDKWGEVYLMNNLGGSSAYEEAWANIEAIYRRPPGGEKHEQHNYQSHTASAAAVVPRQNRVA